MGYYISVAFLSVLMGWLFVPGIWRSSKQAYRQLQSGIPRLSTRRWVALFLRALAKWIGGAAIGGVAIGVIDAILSPNHAISLNFMLSWFMIALSVGAPGVALAWVLVVLWFGVRHLVPAIAAGPRDG